MIKVFLALFISLAYAAEFLEPEDRIIERTSRCEFDPLNSDIFYRIMIFLTAEEVLNLKFLSQGIYRRVRKLWPEMELSTIVNGYCLDRQVSFSHSVEIRGVNLEDRMFPYNRAQLSCLREFLLDCEGTCDLQAVIDLLPRDSLTSLGLVSIKSTSPLIGEIDFPKLTRLELNWCISLNHATFNSLPNCMRTLKLKGIIIDDITSSSLATALEAMNKLEVLSLRCCRFAKNTFPAIFGNLPISLKVLSINSVNLYGKNMKLSGPGFKRLKEMKCLQEIEFCETSNELAIEIILNLPKCITSISFPINRETINAFRQRLDEFTNVERIKYPYRILPELMLNILRIFPNLDEDTKKWLNAYI